MPATLERAKTKSADDNTSRAKKRSGRRGEPSRESKRRPQANADKSNATACKMRIPVGTLVIAEFNSGCYPRCTVVEASDTGAFVKVVGGDHENSVDCETAGVGTIFGVRWDQVQALCDGPAIAENDNSGGESNDAQPAVKRDVHLEHALESLAILLHSRGRGAKRPRMNDAHYEWKPVHEFVVELSEEVEKIKSKLRGALSLFTDGIVGSSKDKGETHLEPALEILEEVFPRLEAVCREFDLATSSLKWKSANADAARVAVAYVGPPELEHADCDR